MGHALCFVVEWLRPEDILEPYDGKAQIAKAGLRLCGFDKNKRAIRDPFIITEIVEIPIVMAASR